MSVLARRLRAQLLVGRKPRAPLPVVERLLAVQAQDERGARLAIRARSAGLTAADVDAALTVDRSLVVTWLNRGTLHLVRSEDYPWLQQLTTPQLRTGTARRLAQEGVSPAAAERGVQAIRRALEEGPLARNLLRERLADAGVRTQGQAFVHLLALASIRGLIVRGPMLAGRQAFVLVRDWLASPARSTVMPRSPSSPVVTWPDTARRTTPTSPGGPACRCATRGRASGRSPPSSARTSRGSSTFDVAPRPRSCPGRNCSARSSPSCSAGPGETQSSETTRVAWSAAACSGRSLSSAGAQSPPGRSRAASSSSRRSGLSTRPTAPRSQRRRQT